MLQLQLLPARQGDAIWVKWGERALTHQLIVDMGTEATGKLLRSRLMGQGTFELLVVTHIDADHIGGVISCLVEPTTQLRGTRFREVWFNGLGQAEQADEVFGARQGHKLSKWLEQQSWNERFGGAPIVREGRPKTFGLAGGLKVTVLGPTRERLTALGTLWTNELLNELAKGRARGRAEAAAVESREEMEGDETFGGRPRQLRPALGCRDDLVQLASAVCGTDTTVPNGSSIVLLLEHGRHAVLLAGDAYAQDLVDGIAALKRKSRLRLDAFKLPHHGSRKNTTAALIDAVDCPLFLFSTDGTQFQHPDAATVACVIAGARRRKRGRQSAPVGLGFNYRSDFTRWWEDESWAKAFDYRVTYGTDTDGLVVGFSVPQRAAAGRRHSSREARRRR